MAYEMVMPYHLHMPSYFLETYYLFDFEEFKAQVIEKLKAGGIAIRQGRGIGTAVGESAEQRPGRRNGQ